MPGKPPAPDPSAGHVVHEGVEHADHHVHKPTPFLLLSLGALGVIYGDIGTSPLYAMREAFSGTFHVEPTPAHVLGVLSLVTWTLVLIAAIKYHILVLRTDNQGEGGILALTALLSPQLAKPDRHGRTTSRPRMILIYVGLFGAALLFGDGILTPAISVLSAVEGLNQVSPTFGPFIVPLTLIILVGLFMLQRTGTGSIGRFFGPITLLWFITLATLGVRGILLAPNVLEALNPMHGFTFLRDNQLAGFLVLAAVFLVVTGVEGLYADLGHFGAGPIQFDGFLLVLPSLLLNYFGQGALILSDPTAASSPFFSLAPRWALVPLVILSTVATIIASQAIITGMFSLGTQATQLGFWPRLDIRHTSAREYGQVYVPQINWALFIGTVVLVLFFQTSSALVAAYGVAIVCTMLVTTTLLFVVLPQQWGWPKWLSTSVLGIFLLIELLFFGANVAKIHEGGWVPLAVAAALFLMMTTWRTGRSRLAERIRRHQRPMEDFVAGLDPGIFRAPGNAIYMTGNPRMTPPALVMITKHQKSLHENVVVLNVENVKAPRVSDLQRLEIVDLGRGFHRVSVRYGFMETPDMMVILDLLNQAGLDLKLDDTTFVLGRERVRSTGQPLVARWRNGLFSFLSRNSQHATQFFNLPAGRVIEVGSQIEL